MEEHFVPEYSKHETEFLVDVYLRLNHGNNPLKSSALNEELKKRFNIPTDTVIDVNVVRSFLSTFQGKTRKDKVKLNKNEEMIKHAWIAGVVIGSISFLSWLISLLSNKTLIEGQVLNVFSIIDIMSIYGLSFGIYRKSRTCAITLSAYFLLMKLIQLVSFESPNNIFALFGMAIFMPFLIRGVIGTFKYHELSEGEME